MAVKTAELSSSLSLEREAKVLLDVQGCPSVIQCFGQDFTTDENGDTVFNLLLEYASGGTLDQLIKKSRGRGLPESEVRWYTKSILEGVKHIHQCDYVHCDLTPENILLDPNPTAPSGSTSFVAKIADFGLAKRAKENLGGWRGSPMYLSPDALLHNVQDLPSDIWSVGCIVLEMLTGKQPWDLSSARCFSDFLDMVCFDSPEIPAEILDVGKDFLNSCLEKWPRNRLTAEELLSYPFITKPVELEGDNGASTPTTARVEFSSSSDELNQICNEKSVKTSSLAYSDVDGCCFKPNVDYYAGCAIVPEVQPPPAGFVIPAGV